jgi:hypothetical protein
MRKAAVSDRLYTSQAATSDQAAPSETLRPTRATGRWLAAGLGVLLVAVALALPPSSLLHALRPEPGPTAPSLLLGARLFTVFLALLGLQAFALAWWLPAGSPAAAARRRGDAPAIAVGLVAVLIVAAGLRFHALDAGLWYDEILMQVKYGSLSFGEVVTTYDSQNQHVLYTLLAQLAVGLVGDGAWALRLPAVLFGIASVGALYLFAREMVPAREALSSAALIAVSYHHVWFSQNARGYSGVLFWTLLSSWLLIRALREGRRPLWVAYALAAALGAATHLTMLFVIGGHVAIYAAELRTRRATRWDGALIGFPLAATLIALVHALVLPQVLASVADESSWVATWRHPLWTLAELAGGVRLGFSGVGLALAAVLVFALGLWGLARKAPAVVIVLVVPVVLCTLAAMGTGHHLWPRFYFFAIGFGAVVVVHGAGVLGRALGACVRLSPAGIAVASTVATLALVAGAAFAVPTAYAPKQDYAGALRFVETNRQPGDVVVTAGLAALPYREYHKTDWQRVDSVEALTHARAEARRTWVVYTLPLQIEARSPDLLAAIRREFPVVRRFPGTLSGGEIVVRRANRDG